MINHLKNAFFISLFFVFLTISGFSQTVQNSIRGTVSDSNGAAVAGAKVKVRNKNSGSEQQTVTDGQGGFEITNLPNGVFAVNVEAPGFSNTTREVSLDNNSVENLEIGLSVGNISESVSVTATRTQIATTDTAVPVSVVDREQIERQTPATIGDVFRDLPGTSTVNEGSFQVRPRIRGLDSNRVLVLVDGERLNNARTSTSQSGIELGLVGTEQIETLEVTRGSGSVLYGTDALAGTVNIITKDAPRNADGGFRFGATFNGYYSSNDSGRRGSLALTGSGKFFSFRVAQSLERFDNYFSGDLNGVAIDGVDSDGEVQNSQSHGSNTQITTRFFLNDDNDLKLNYERRRAGNIGVPTLVGVFNAFFPFSDRDKFSGRFETRDLNDSLARVSASFYFQKQKRNFSNILDVPAFPPFFPGQFQFSETVTDTKSYGVDLQSNWLLGNGNFLTAGFSFFRDQNEDERFIERLDPDFSVFPPVLIRSEDRSKSVPNASYSSYAFFAQDEFEVNKRLKLIGGIRFDRFNSKSDPTEGFALPPDFTQVEIDTLGLNGLTDGLNVSQTAFTGDFGAVFKLTPDVSLTGRIGRSYRVPNLFERFFTDAGSVGDFVVGNPDLKPESGINVDLGVKFKTTKYAGSVTYFNNTYRNFLTSVLARYDNGDPIDLPNVGQVYQTRNIDRARIQGVEADFEYPIKLGLGFLTPGGNFTYLRGDNLGADEPLNTISPTKTVLNLRWQNLKSQYYFDWATRIVTKQERLSQSFLDTNGGPEPGFVTSDIRGGYNFAREHYRLSFNLGVTNLFDRFYREQFVFAPARGRSFVFGTTWEIF
ncbi:MAG: TonB-dependent receptor [Pyrinomonadaceae bacterium]